MSEQASIIEALGKTDPLRYETFEAQEGAKKMKEKLEKQQKENNELQRLFYEIFNMTEDGRKVKKIIESRILYNFSVNPYDSSATTASLYMEGYRAGVLSPFVMADEHALKIAGVNG